MDKAVEAVCFHLEALLTTPDQSIRESANKWLTDVFRSSQEAWGTSVKLITQTDVRLGSNVRLEDLQLFGAQTLYQKLNDDINQIFSNQQQCAELCNFIMNQILSLPSAMHFEFMPKPLRSRLSDCLAVAAVSFIGGPWPTALEDIICAGMSRHSRNPASSTLTSEECFVRSNLMHVLSELPELVSALERKRYLMQCLGHINYTSWKKTEAGLKILGHIPKTSQLIGETLRLALMSWTDQTANVEALATLVHEALNTAIQWSQTFDVSIIIASNDFLDSTLLRQLLDNNAMLYDPVVAEMFASNISRLVIPRDPFGKSVVPFTLDLLGTTKHLVEPVLVFLYQKLLIPFLTMMSGSLDTPPTLNQLESHGGQTFLNFAYHWVPTVYALAVVAPDLLSFQTTPIKCYEGGGLVEFPSKLVVQLLKVESLLHPITHTKILELWTDVVDMQNDKELNKENVRLILDELVEITLKCLLTHSRRDNPVWTSDSVVADPDGRSAYIDQCQDCIVSLYFLYQGLNNEQAVTLVRYLTSEFTRAVEPASLDAPLAAACLLLIDCVVEAVIDFSSGDFVWALNTICDKAPLDSECVCIVANLVKKQAIFLTDSEHVELWIVFFRCLMRLFDVEPRLCAKGIFELCESGGDLGLRQMSNSTDLIRNFYSVRVSTTIPTEKAKTLSTKQEVFISFLWGALASLIRRLSPSESPAIFAESLSILIQEAESFYKAAQNGSSEAMKSLVLVLRSICHSIWALENDVARINHSNRSSKQLNRTFVCRFLFGASSDDLSNWQKLYDAASLLIHQTVYTAPLSKYVNGQLVPAVDCYANRKFEEKITMPEISLNVAHNVAIHIIRQAIRSCPLDMMPQFWESIYTLTIKLSNLQSVVECDTSVCFCLRDILERLQNYNMEKGQAPIESNNENFKDNNYNYRSNLIAFPAASYTFNVINQHIIPKIVAKASTLPVAVWGTSLKPFFSLMEVAIGCYTDLNVWDFTNIRNIMPVFVRALQCPSSKLQQSNLEVLRKLFAIREPPSLLSIIMEFYSDLVQAFWLHCHLWDFQRITRAINLMEHLVRPICFQNSVQEFLHTSQKIYETKELYGGTLNLATALSESDFKMVLELLQHIRGFRLRQLLMDLIKISKRAATTDCLISYEFVLDDLSRAQTLRPLNNKAAQQAIIDVD